MPQTTSRRSRVAGCVLVLIGVLASGCAGEEPLQRAALVDSLLTTENLGPGWVQQPAATSSPSPAAATSDDGSDCTRDLKPLDAVEQATASFNFTQGSLQVENGVSTYEDENDVATKLSDDYGRLQSPECRRITTKTPTASLTATVEADQDKSDDTVDGQLNVTSTGHYVVSGEKLPFSALFTVARIGPNLTSIRTAGTTDIEHLHQAYVEIAIARLRAVAAGEEPPKTVAPAPTQRPSPS